MWIFRRDSLDVIPSSSQKHSQFNKFNKKEKKLQIKIPDFVCSTSNHFHFYAIRNLFDFYVKRDSLRFYHDCDFDFILNSDDFDFAAAAIQLSGDSALLFILVYLLCCFKESFLFSWWSILDVTELSYQKDAS